MLNTFNSIFRAEYDTFEIELAKNYGIPDWKEDLKKVMLKAGLENKQTVFLFSDTQVTLFSFLVQRIFWYLGERN